MKGDNDCLFRREMGKRNVRLDQRTIRITYLAALELTRERAAPQQGHNSIQVLRLQEMMKVRALQPFRFQRQKADCSQICACNPKRVFRHDYHGLGSVFKQNSVI